MSSIICRSVISVDQCEVGLGLCHLGDPAGDRRDWGHPDGPCIIARREEGGRLDHLGQAPEPVTGARGLEKLGVAPDMSRETGTDGGVVAIGNPHLGHAACGAGGNTGSGPEVRVDQERGRWGTPFLAAGPGRQLDLRSSVAGTGDLGVTDS